MIYVIDNNVEFVGGAKNTCIYNLNSGKLYSIDSLFRSQIEQLLNAQGQGINEDLSTVKELLIKEKILVDLNNLSPKRAVTDSHLNAISFAWIEITQNCNLRCLHCYEESSAERKSSQMNFSDFKIAIQRHKEYQIRNIQLIGGEPLSHPEILQIIDYCSIKFDYIEIFTNGTLINDILLEKIKQSKIRLAFSIYAENARLHDSVTQVAGSFDKSYRNLQKAIALGIECRVASVEMINVPQFSFSSIGVEHRNDLPRITGKANLQLFIRDMVRRKLITKKTFSTPIDANSIYQNMNSHNCFRSKLYIDVDLNVFPCVMERRFLHGNIRNNKLADEIDPSIIRINKDMIDGCQYCEFRYACFDCRPDANGNSRNAKPWFCTYNPQLGVWYNEDDFIDELLFQYERGEKNGTI